MSSKVPIHWLVLVSILLCVIPSAAPAEERSRASDSRIVLGEMFTGTWCTPCIDADAGMDMLVDDSMYFDERFVLVEYHAGDDYEIPETDQRSSYYLVSGYPSAVIDGVEKLTGDQGTPEDNYQAYRALVDSRPASAYYSLLVEWTIEGDEANYNIVVTVENTVPLAYQGLSAYGVIVEDHDVELETGHILRMTAVNMPINDDAVPARGSGDDVTFHGNLTIDPAWAKEDLALVFWVQSDTSREVLQAGIGYPTIEGGEKNSPPQYVGGDLDFSMEEDSVDSHIYLKEVFSDPDRDVLTFAADGSLHINVEVDSESYLRVTPEGEWSGSETIYISAKDKENPQVTHAVKVTVIAVNDPPRIVGSLSGLLFEEDTTSVTSPIRSVFNDPDGDQLSFMVENMVHLRAVKNSDTTLTIEPKENWNGYENLVIKASDGEYETTYDDVVRVTPVNDEPTISSYEPPDWTEVGEGGSLVLSVTATDLEGDRLSYSWELDGANQPGKSSSFTYEPDYGDRGEHTVLVKVNDGAGGLVSHAFQIIVIEGNRAPTASITSPLAGKTYEEGDKVLFMCEVSDPDDPYGRYIEYEWLIDGTLLSNEATFSYSPDEGSHIIVLKVTDGEFEVEDKVTIVIEEKKGSGIPGFGALHVLVALAVTALSVMIRGRHRD